MCSEKRIIDSHVHWNSNSQKPRVRARAHGWHPTGTAFDERDEGPAVRSPSRKERRLIPIMIPIGAIT